MSLLPFLALAQAAAGPAAAAPPATDEIVVRAARGKCRVEFAEKTMTSREFDARAKLWAAGRPVRVVEPRGATHECLAKIAFKLADRGVRAIVFVDPPASE